MLRFSSGERFRISFSLRKDNRCQKYKNSIDLIRVLDMNVLNDEKTVDLIFNLRIDLLFDHHMHISELEFWDPILEIDKTL